MWLQKLQAYGLRCFDQVELNFTPGINVLYGGNGVGKTSILEGISVLSCGKSFRTSKLSHILNDQVSQLILFGEVNLPDQSRQLGVQYDGATTKLRVDQKDVGKWSDLAKILPVLEIHPESYLLISGGPIERRKFLNWGMFHVEPSFGKTWYEYSRALKHRNSCLRNKRHDQAKNWHNTLAGLGENISIQLTHYTEQIIPYVNHLTDLFLLSDQVSLEYDRGWSHQHDLLQLLDQELLQENVGFTTMYGPHRGNLIIKWRDQLFAKSSSRGQQKVMAIALKIAQAQFLTASNHTQSLYLIDELPAELDQKRQQIAFNLLNDIESQIIISAVTEDSTKYKDSNVKWFHVEHSGVTSMV